LKWEHFMTGVARSLTQIASGLLEPEARDAVIGDLTETGTTPWRGLVEILGLIVRREAALWTTWRPWLAGFGVALPSTFLLMGVSFSISCTYERLGGGAIGSCVPTGHEGPLLLLCHLSLLMLWSWTGGFVVGALSRRTLWVSAALSLLACTFCLTRFHEVALSRTCLLLFIPPAILGIWRARRNTPLKTTSAIVVALAATGLTLCAWTNGALWMLNWALIGPAWYMVLQARGSKTCETTSSW
jgi:hypothetical protein